MLCLCQCVYVLYVYPSEDQCLHWVERWRNSSTRVSLMIRFGVNIGIMFKSNCDNDSNVRISKVFGRLAQELTDKNTKLWMCHQTEGMPALVLCANIYICTIFKDRRRVALEQEQDILMTTGQIDVEFGVIIRGPPEDPLYLVTALIFDIQFDNNVSPKLMARFQWNLLWTFTVPRGSIM